MESQQYHNHMALGEKKKKSVYLTFYNKTHILKLLESLHKSACAAQLASLGPQMPVLQTHIHSFTH